MSNIIYSYFTFCHTQMFKLKVLPNSCGVHFALLPFLHVWRKGNSSEVYFYIIFIFNVFQASIQSVLFSCLSANESQMNRSTLTVSVVMWPGCLCLTLTTFILYLALSVFQKSIQPRVRIPSVGLWHFSCDLFYCPESAGHGSPLRPSPCHQLWQSQPLFMQWEAAFFQRDDLLCLHRHWHQGCDPTQGLDSTRRKLGTKYTSCHPNSAIHMLLQTHSPTSEWDFDGSCSLQLTGPSNIISTGIMEPAQEDQILWGK